MQGQAIILTQLVAAFKLVSGGPETTSASKQRGGKRSQEIKSAPIARAGSRKKLGFAGAG
jgi:hypothetical protein